MTSAQAFPRSARHTEVGHVILVVLLMFGLSVGAGCRTHDLPMSDAQGARPRPPPKVGSSITHSQLCRCFVCADPACCTREAEGEQETEACNTGPDGQIQCGLAMKSCGRCQDATWRVSLSETCEAKRPADCCKEVAVRR